MKKLSHMLHAVGRSSGAYLFCPGSADHAAGQGGQDKLVEIVRNATTQYQDVTKQPPRLDTVLSSAA